LSNAVYSNFAAWFKKGKCSKLHALVVAKVARLAGRNATLAAILQRRLRLPLNPGRREVLQSRTPRTRSHRLPTVEEWSQYLPDACNSLPSFLHSFVRVKNHGNYPTMRGWVVLRRDARHRYSDWRRPTRTLRFMTFCCTSLTTQSQS
jgi:hypothetical protein